METRSLAVLTSMLWLVACTPPPPGVHEVLKISDQGAYTLNGVAVPKAQLATALTQEQGRVKALFAEIVASPHSDMAAVTYAVEALKAAQVRFAFIDEQIMNSGKQLPAGDVKDD